MQQVCTAKTGKVRYVVVPFRREQRAAHGREYLTLKVFVVTIPSFRNSTVREVVLFYDFFILFIRCEALCKQHDAKVVGGRKHSVDVQR